MTKQIFFISLLLLCSIYAHAESLTTCYVRVGDTYGSATPPEYRHPNSSHYLNIFRELIDAQNAEFSIWYTVHPDAEQAKRQMLRYVDYQKELGYSDATFLGCKTDSLTN